MKTVARLRINILSPFYRGIIISLCALVAASTTWAQFDLECAPYPIKNGKVILYVVKQNNVRISPVLKNQSECQALIQIINHRHRNDFNVIQTNDLRYFHTSGPSEQVGFTLRSCKVPSLRYHPARTDGDGYLAPECAPDTLYSWGGPDKATWFIDNLGDNTKWSGILPRSLYTVSSAASTFGYGVIPLRFKIRDGVKFKLLKNPKTNLCEEFVSAGYANEGELNTTIFSRLAIRANFSFYEHIICSPKVIASWSFGYTYTHDEILADHEWMLSHRIEDWESYVHEDGKNVYINSGIDRAGLHTDFSLKSFLQKIALLRALGDARAGYLSAESGQFHDDRVKTHFDTEHPIYFHP